MIVSLNWEHALGLIVPTKVGQTTAKIPKLH